MKTCRGENETANFARRRRLDGGGGLGGRAGWSLSCNTKTRKTTGYSRCAFVSRAQSRKDAAGILAGASVVILIVTEGGVRFSCFLTCAARICITMFRHGRARVRTNVQTSFLFLSLPSRIPFLSGPFFHSFSPRVPRKEKEKERARQNRKLMPRII